LLITNLESNLSYSLYSQNGQLVQTGKLQGATQSIDLGMYAKGIYLLEISNSIGLKQVEKIINLSK
jgi:hypothetical protein